MKRSLYRAVTIVASIAALVAPVTVAQANSAPVTTKPATATATCDEPVVYFDLGHVLIDTNDWNNLRYVRGAKQYLNNLRSSGIEMGLIVNIPASWGTDDAERVTALKEFIAKTWVETSPFVWDYFGDRIFLPRTDEERKPATAMFERGLTAAAPCDAVFQGEVVEELDAAASVGLRTYHVGQRGQKFFMPINHL